MYKHLTKADLLRTLNQKEDYSVHGLLVIGTHPKEKEYPHLYETLERIGLPYTEEKIEDRFFSDVKSFVIGGKRIWFDVVYGAAYLSEIIHMASMLGSKNNILLGTFGALQADTCTGDIVLPEASYGNESATRMYQRENTDFLYSADKGLVSTIRKHFSQRKIHDGKMVTVQAMLGETKDDVDLWSKQGYKGVDMESATMFAVSNHFKVPSASLLYAADNLLKNELTTDPAFEMLRTQRTTIKKENYEVALRVLLGLSPKS